MKLSVVIITFNEEDNIARALDSVASADERIVVDAESTDGTVNIARAHGAIVYVEPWKGYAPQRICALSKCTGDWIFVLDADEVVDPQLLQEIRSVTSRADRVRGYFVKRKNYFLGRWMRHGGYYPDPKLRLMRRGYESVIERPVHEALTVDGPTATLEHELVHLSYPTLEQYLDHMNRYSTLGAEIVVASGERHFSLFDVLLRPFSTFVYNYFLRLGLLDGREGLLLHLYHAVYVSWKYAKAWELARRASGGEPR
ncbi:MAG: glycosyltransferase family 2 protein [Acidobacteriaceae bacterium]|nr:glycosyltransferase family 2 protein [Acidobacteriaceae bacterium]